jgi:hypothetical protein
LSRRTASKLRLGHLDVGSLLAELIGALGGVHAGLRRETWVVGHHLAGEVDAIALSHYVAGLVGAAELHPHPIGLAGPGPEALAGLRGSAA